MTGGLEPWWKVKENHFLAVACWLAPRRMPLSLLFHHVQVGDRDLLEGVSWRLMPGDRVGLVGSNGAGKSTLLKCLTGVRPVDAGRMVVAHKVELGYLEQASSPYS